MGLKVTSDMFDDSFDGVSMDKKTISYWLYKSSIHEPIELVFVTSMKMFVGPSGATDEDTINLKFILDPHQFETGLAGNGGSPEMKISGQILSVSEVIRDTTSVQ